MSPDESRNRSEIVPKSFRNRAERSFGEQKTDTLGGLCLGFGQMYLGLDP